VTHDFVTAEELIPEVIPSQKYPGTWVPFSLFKGREADH
jgi:hypothetical protein